MHPNHVDLHAGPPLKRKYDSISARHGNCFRFRVVVIIVFCNFGAAVSKNSIKLSRLKRTTDSAMAQPEVRYVKARHGNAG